MSEAEDSQQSEAEEAAQTVSEELGFAGPGEELAAITARMDQIKEEVTADLLATWPSPWKNDSMVNAKVSGRLGSNKAFQVLLARRRELDEELGADSYDRGTDDAQDPMGAYSIQVAKDRGAAEAEKANS